VFVSPVSFAATTGNTKRPEKIVAAQQTMLVVVMLTLVMLIAGITYVQRTKNAEPFSMLQI
jgi:hypothetical protein